MSAMTSASQDCLNHETVLVVDDEQPIRDLCRAFLKTLECDVILAESGSEALEIMEQTRVDVVVSDHSMPGMTGVELLGRILEKHPQAVRILTTGVVDTRIAEQALNHAETFRFLVKPFSRESFRNAVSQALDYGRLATENRRFREEMETLVREQAQDLAEAKGFLESLLQALPAGVVAVAADGRVTRANPAAHRILGTSEGHLEGRPAPDMGAPCRPGLCFAPATDQAGAGSREVELKGRGDRPRVLLWSCERVGGSEGDPGGCVASFLDISEKKDLENEVLHAKQEIESIFDSVTDPTCAVDADLTVLRANRAFFRFVGELPEKIVGRPVGELLAATGVDCAPLRLSGVFDAGERGYTELRDAQERVLKIHAFPIVEDDRVESVVVRFQDVTSERELEKRLIQSEKMASVGQLAAGVAHEINNPVGFILSNLNRLAEYAGEFATLWQEFKSLGAAVGDSRRSATEGWDELLKGSEKADLGFLVEDLKDVVAECREGADRIRKIVRDLKTFSHPDAMDGEYADLNDGIEGTLNIVWNELKYKCEVEKDLGEIPKVLCRPQQLNQVFMNMLVNAGQAIPDKGTITVRTRAVGHSVLVSISDTGVGIAPENQDRIFDPFFTTKPVGEGTGLGLHLAADIVRGHGGEIRLHSVLGEGSTFTVVLPIAPSEGFRPATESASPAWAASAAT